MNRGDRVAEMTETTFAEKASLYALFDSKWEIIELIEGLRSFSRKCAWNKLLASEDAMIAYAHSIL